MAEEHKDEFQVWLSRLEARMLLSLAGNRLENMMAARASGQITGERLDKRIAVWQEIIRKLGSILEENSTPKPTKH